MLYLLLISTANGYRFHSAHKDKAKAEIYRECKQQDGDDTALMILNRDDLVDLQSEIESALDAPPVK